MTREEKQKAINALKISAPVMAMTQEEFDDYIQTLNKIMDWLEQETVSKESSRDIEEIAEIMKCDADAETKYKMISNILTAKPHYFERQEPCDYTGNEFFNFDAPMVKKSMECQKERIKNDRSELY